MPRTCSGHWISSTLRGAIEDVLGRSEFAGRDVVEICMFNSWGEA